MNSEQKDFYIKLRKDIDKWVNTKFGQDNRWSEIILLAPDLFHLLCKLVIDPDVPISKKAKLAAAISYFISPIDLMPEIILGPVGYLDDIALSAYVLNDIINEIDPKIIKKHWAGEKDVLHLVKTILANMNKFISQDMWRRIKNKFEKLTKKFNM